MTAKTAHEAAAMGRCLDLCDSLQIEEFSYKSLAKIVDLRPALGKKECFLTKVNDPESFLVVRRDSSCLSPLVEIDNELIWAFEAGANKYQDNPELIHQDRLQVLSARRGN
jgi:hypothetical protein